jgi:hypothetical protein
MFSKFVSISPYLIERFESINLIISTILQSDLPWLVPANPERTDCLQGSGTLAYLLHIDFSSYSCNWIICAGVLVGPRLSYSKTHCWPSLNSESISSLRFLHLQSITALHFVSCRTELNCSSMINFAHPVTFSTDIQDAGPMAHPICPHSYIKVIILNYSVIWVCSLIQPVSITISSWCLIVSFNLIGRWTTSTLVSFVVSKH